MEYHKIHSVFKRDPETNFKTFLKEFSLPEFDYLKDSLWYGTEKVDGTNIRIYKDPFHSPIGTYWAGRTDRADIPKGLNPALKGVHDRLWRSDLPSSTVLYGEGYGAGIQKGGDYRPDMAFVLFDVNINGLWQERDNVYDIGEKLNVPVVPYLGEASLLRWVESVQDPDWSARESRLHPGARNEGVVLKPMVELQNRRGERIITKLKFSDYPS